MSTKRERNATKALKRSLRNSPPLTPGARLKRPQRRLAARLAAPQQPAVASYDDSLDSLTVPELKKRAMDAGHKGVSRMKRDELLALLG